MGGYIYTQGEDMNYQEMLSIVQRYPVQAGESTRVNCPNCGGNKTLSLTKRDGQLFWNCFKASCDLTGRSNVGRNQQEVREYLSGRTHTIKKRTPDIPSIQSAPANNPEVLAYLEQNNCYSAFADKIIKISYSPAEKRVLFYTPDEKGCVGRALNRGVKPKWKAYGEFNSLFSVGNKPVAVVVEDAASACAVYATGDYTGVALLGTHMSLSQRKALLHYSRVIICLDKDASKKAVYLAKQLRGTVQAGVRLLTKDLKQYQPEEIKEILKNESPSVDPSRHGC